jgi:hypothetical protein
VSILVAQWGSGDYITFSKVDIDPPDMCRNRILSFYLPDTSERNIHILNDLMWAFQWLNGGVEILLHYPKYILIHWTCAGIEYCLSIHQIHQKEIFRYSGLVWVFWWLNHFSHDPSCILILGMHSGHQIPSYVLILGSTPAIRCYHVTSYWNALQLTDPSNIGMYSG